MALRVIVLTCNKYQWLIQPFAYLFNRYWSELQPVVIGGFDYPSFPTPPNFVYHRIDREDYPASRWSDALIKLLVEIPDQHIVLLLEDYFLIRTVDCEAVRGCYEYIRQRPEVLRIDLTADRLYAGGMFDVESYGRLDIIETPESTPYQFSTQAGIWNKKLLLDLLVPGKSGWEVEIQTSVPKMMRVLGTRQYPVRYANAMYQGKLQQSEIDKIPGEHKEYIQQKGWLLRA